MKKLIPFLIATCALVLAGCQNKDSTEVNQTLLHVGFSAVYEINKSVLNSDSPEKELTFNISLFENAESTSEESLFEVDVVTPNQFLITIDGETYDLFEYKNYDLTFSTVSYAINFPAPHRESRQVEIIFNGDVYSSISFEVPALFEVNTDISESYSLSQDNLAINWDSLEVNNVDVFLHAEESCTRHENDPTGETFHVVLAGTISCPTASSATITVSSDYPETRQLDVVNGGGFYSYSAKFGQEFEQRIPVTQ